MLCFLNSIKFAISFTDWISDPQLQPYSLQVLQILKQLFPIHSLSVCPSYNSGFLTCVLASELWLPEPGPLPMLAPVVTVSKWLLCLVCYFSKLLYTHVWQRIFSLTYQATLLLYLLVHPVCSNQEIKPVFEVNIKNGLFLS